MKQVVLNIKENKFQFFMELIQNLDFVKIEDGDKKKAVSDNIKSGIEELNLINEGKKEATLAKDFLDEL